MTSNLANTYQVLKQVSEKQWSGCVLISQPKDYSVKWQLYFNNGELQYATSSIGQAERLSYLWKQQQLNLELPKLNDRDSEYQQLWNYFEKNKTSQLKLTKIFQSFSQEALIQVLSFKETKIKLIPNQLLEQNSFNFSWIKLITDFKQLIQEWQELLDHCDSPFNRVYLDNKNTFSFYKTWKKVTEVNQIENLVSFGKISTIVEIFSKKKSFYQLAVELEVEPLNLIKILHPFIQENIIEILPWQERVIKPAENTKNNQSTSSSEIDNTILQSRSNQVQLPSTSNNQRPLIACIDDSNTVQKQVKMILESVGYDVIGITESANALRGLSRQQPVLILMDINMPDINGYDLCSMLRRSQKFKEIPIVMLTGRDGIIDRMRAKFVGANNYLTKPFQPDQLIALVREISLPVASM